MSSGGFLNAQLSKKTSIFGLKLWVLIGIAVGAFIVLILFVLSLWLTSRRKSRRLLEKLPMTQIPTVSKEIKEVKIDRKAANNIPTGDGILLTFQGKSSDRDSDKVLVHVGVRNSSDGEKNSPGGSIVQQEKGEGSQSGEEGSSGNSVYRGSSSYAISASSPMNGMPEVSHLGWGHWFTLDRYVAPEYANTGLLNERSDVYSFGVLLLEAITGRDPVDYGRPAGEVNLVDWLKMMVGSRRSEEVLDPNLEVKPSTRALKKALLVALRCVDPDSEKRPKMGHVVHMHEADEFPLREDRRSRANRARSIEAVNQGGIRFQCWGVKSTVMM